ncbi:MAG TPA: DUF1592 domain-containing protein, partial [Gemmataceae bacterium]|nr:DUF1592 domain-containing protein [Gemmataceae bacterium]
MSRSNRFWIFPRPVPRRSLAGAMLLADIDSRWRLEVLVAKVYSRSMRTASAPYSRSRLFLVGLLAALSVIALVAGRWTLLAQGPAEPAGRNRNETAIPRNDRNAVALFEKYCFECHGDGVRRGDLALDELLKAPASDDSRRGWLKPWKIVRHEFMPPTGHPSPTAEERRTMFDWIAAAKLGVDFARPDPGRVTIRRLNRMEYENSVQDLFGIDFASESEYSSDIGDAVGNSVLRLRDRLPPDETAYGFDNIGDFLTLPPPLLERYFDIAELVVDRVLPPEGARSPERVFTPAMFRTVRSEAAKIEQTAAFDAPHPGKYAIETRFIVGGWNEFGGTYDFAAKIGTEAAGSEKVDVGGYKRIRVSKTVELPARKHPIVLSTTPQVTGKGGARKPLELRPTVRVIGPLGDQYLEHAEPYRRIFFKGEPPADRKEQRAYAREILERIASRAFRRPVDPQTLDGLTDLAAKNTRFDRGIAQATTAILTSPRFLFRAETQPRPDDPKSVHPLDEYSLASRLSYLLWLSLPDEELTRLAAQGELGKNLASPAKRMLADPKSARFFEDFPGQWLRTRNVLMTSISVRGAADKLDKVRKSMKQETEMLFGHIARGDRDLIELVTADYTFLDKPLADFYGIKGVPDKGVHKVSLGPDSHRAGILAHGSFLVATSNPNRTSPVKRGLFVLENLLAIEPPPPPPNIPALDDVKIEGAAKKMGRELLALHRAQKSCAACHAHFDPIGIALENYDVIGRWRTEENGRPIDTAEKTTTGEKIAGLGDVRDLLVRKREKFYQGVATKFMTYALGRALEPADFVTVDRAADRMMAEGGKFSVLLTTVLDSPAFRTRRGDDAGGVRGALS